MQAIAGHTGELGLLGAEIDDETRRLVMIGDVHCAMVGGAAAVGSAIPSCNITGVCVYVCVCVWNTHIHTYTHTQTRKHANTHTHTHTYTHTHIGG